MVAKYPGTEDIEDKIKDIIRFIGDDPNREGLKETPKRMIKSWKELFSGYKENPKELIKTFKEGTCNEMVILKDIDFFSMCEHHFLPFFGKIFLGYVPNGRVVGVSKLVRLIEVYSRRLQIQEKMTTEIADTLMDGLKPLGVMVVCKAQHLCMISRGVKKQNVIMVTSAVRGVFDKEIETRNEFMELIK
ncbi:GTP cyclohydrolase 1 [subsurface metagenome]